MIKYNVDKNNRTIVAYFEGGITYWYDCLLHKATKTDNYCMLDDQIISNIVLDNLVNLNGVLFGMAKASETDYWNEETGKDVARAKLLRKYYNTEIRILKKMRDLIESYAKISHDNIQNVINNHTLRVFDYKKLITSK